MQESYEKDLASHLGLEPYADDGNVVGVASGERYRQAGLLSSEITISVCRHRWVAWKAIRCFASWQVEQRHGGVIEPEHVWKLQSREPGDPIGFRLNRIGTVSERLRRYCWRVRRWEVRWVRSTCEAGEQRWG